MCTYSVVTCMSLQRYFKITLITKISQIQFSPILTNKLKFTSFDKITVSGALVSATYFVISITLVPSFPICFEANTNPIESDCTTAIV